MGATGPPSATEVRLRDFRPTDRAGVERCLTDLLDRMIEVDPWERLLRGPGFGPAILRHELAQVRRNSGFVLVADRGGEIVGVAVAWIRRVSALDRLQERPNRCGYVSELSVRAGFRGQGIGSRLLGEAERRFRLMGCDLTSLGVFPPNRRARRLYRRTGYAPRGLFLVKRLAPPYTSWSRALRRPAGPFRRARGSPPKRPAGPSGRGRSPRVGRPAEARTVD